MNPVSSAGDTNTEATNQGKEMEGRKWEKLEMDCLVNIFSRVGLETLLLYVPFVCRSWYEASLNPLCWKILNFHELTYGDWNGTFAAKFKNVYHLQKFSIEGLFKLTVSRSRGSVTHLILDNAAFLTPLSEQFPALKVLAVSDLFLSSEDTDGVKFISKLKNLEWLYMLDVLCPFKEILTEISLHCKKFKGLKVSGFIDKEHASAIVGLLPKIQYLNFNQAFIRRAELILILDGCKELKELHVRDCRGFTVVDDQILRRISRLQIFDCEGSRLKDPELTEMHFKYGFYKAYYYTPEEILLRTLNE